MPDIDAVRQLPAAGRDAHRVQLRLPGAAVGGGVLPRVDRRDPRRPRARWAPRARGCSATTTSPARSPATGARTPRSRSSKKRFGVPTDLELGRHRRAAPRPCWWPRSPAASTSTRATSSGLPEVEDLPLELHRGSDALPLRRARTPGGTDAASRCRGRGDARAVRLQPRRHAALAAAAGGGGGALTVAAQEADPASTLQPLPEALRLRRAASSPTSTTGALEVGLSVAADPEVLAFRRGDRFACIVTTGDAPVTLPPARPCSSRALRSTATCCRATPPRGCSSTRDRIAARPHPPRGPSAPRRLAPTPTERRK